MKQPAYVALANKIAAMIDKGVYKAGDKLPSVRRLHQEHGLSISTILQALNRLIDHQKLTSIEKSGYFVSEQQVQKFPVPRSVPVSLSERAVNIDRLLQKLHKDGKGRQFVSFANAMPDDRLLPFNAIKRAIQLTSRDINGSYLALENSKGSAQLREEIAKRSLLWNGQIHANELVITNGAKEALICCLKAVTRPGDTVLVQDPCYYGIMLALEYLGLKVATIPMQPETGINLADLEDLCTSLKIKACLLVSNFNNPDGISLSTENKKQLADFACKNQIPIVEDDLYGELFFTGIRPDTIKAYDQEGWVMYCSSFTKTIIPGFRIGWCAPGKFAYEVARIKSMQNGSVSNFSQQVVYRLLSQGTYDRHLQKFRLQLHKNMLRTMQLIEQHFPEDTSVSRPNGGLVLWIALPVQVNTTAQQNIAFKKEISYAPGEIFSSKGDYQNYLRLNYCNFWEPKIEQALAKLGKIFSDTIEQQYTI
ncbi:aminotransferase-like domain-containing protein [Mucilaginibacter agri]|uniref:Aminotransferase class I/II-fold pyridoxal phosphate-dependent enzyme n=1 Tax=Mucilaginibacter agri TaxID=2695265 RepID=A0A965ZMQ8_9SPHI|nr:PLP-dependent aminotransferase family protein [Mucilaginibacter agri]NCD72556.1 aminotransferase class I/II-fold pyridoxal phosphate-dependent enzyme [Mucilaginibacter agri]